MTPTPGSVEPVVVAAPRASSGLGWAAAAAMALGLGGVLWYHNGRDAAGGKAAVEAVITDDAGNPPPASAAPGRLLVLSSSKSRGTKRLWSVDLPEDRFRKFADALAIVPAPGDGTIAVRLLVIRNDDIDERVLRIPVAGGPAPAPKPDDPAPPKPTPKPDEPFIPVPPAPKPDEPPPGSVDPLVRTAAAAFFAAYPGYYRNAEVRPGRTFNEISEAMDKERKRLGDSLGQAVNLLIRPADGNDHAYTDADAAAAAAAFRKVGDSLAAGIRDAATAN